LSQRLNQRWLKKPPLLLKPLQLKRLPQKRNISLSFPHKRESMV
jgi:hypothetical protein